MALHQNSLRVHLSGSSQPPSSHFSDSRFIFKWFFTTQRLPLGLEHWKWALVSLEKGKLWSDPISASQGLKAYKEDGETFGIFIPPRPSAELPPSQPGDCSREG